MNYTHVHTPITLGQSCTLKNRIVRTAHGTVLGKGRMSDTLIAYHEARARGGVALSIVEIGSVHPSSPFMLHLYDLTVDDGYGKLLDRCKPHGMKIFQQLWHGGHHARPLDGSPPWSSSVNPSVETGIVPLRMTKSMISEVIDAYASTARRMETVGLDGVDIHCAHGYLPAQFLSRAINDREDEYGGETIEERARFVIELLEAVRGAVSSDFVVGVRLAPDLLVGGVDVAQNLRVAELLEARGLTDYVSVSNANYNTFDKIASGMHDPVGYMMETTLPITTKVKSPTLAIGRYRTLEEADQLIRSGGAELVGMVRATIADPDLVNKSLAGKVEQVRPCIGCNQSCLAQVQSPYDHMECAVNPGTGHELYRGDHALRPSVDPKMVLVVGGGPAGMEAARVAALRGHKVTLAEASRVLGGTLRLACKAPTRHGLIDIVTWLESEIYRLGVEVRLSTYMDADDVAAGGAEAVIVATGAFPRMDGVIHSHPGQPVRNFDRKNVISGNDLFLEPPAELGKSAVVIDDAGHYEAIACCEMLIEKGLAVTYITRHRMIAQLIQPTAMVEPFLRRMKGNPFKYMIRHRVVELTDAGAILCPHHFAEDEEPVTIPADTVVFVSLNRPNREIFDTLRERNTDMRVVGDANSPRFLPVAIREGHMAGASI